MTDGIWILLAFATGFGAATLLARRRRQRLVHGLARALRRVFEAPGTAEDFDLPPEARRLRSILVATRRRVRRHLDALRAGARELETLVRSLREGVIVADAEGRIRMLNPAAASLLDLPHADEPETYVGRMVEQCIWRPALRRLLRAEDPTRDAESDEARIEIPTPTGTRHVLARAADLPAEDGERRRLLVLSDITALVQMVQVKADFVANASHELRTPVSTILASVETLASLDLTRESDAARRFIDIIGRHARRLGELAGDMLELHRLESSGLAVQPREIQVASLLDELRLRFEPLARDKGVGYESAAEPAELSLRTDDRLLHLILSNLIDNAIKFTDAGGHVRVEARRLEDGVVEFEVADDGCGIPLEDQPRVFERFYQVRTDRSGPKRGTGLGLAIVRHAARALRAEPELTSAPGRGTTVRVRVPDL